jgi:hypothetical protein
MEIFLSEIGSKKALLARRKQKAAREIPAPLGFTVSARLEPYQPLRISGGE